MFCSVFVVSVCPDEGRIFTPELCNASIATTCGAITLVGFGLAQRAKTGQHQIVAFIVILMVIFRLIKGGGIKDWGYDGASQRILSL